MTFRLYKMSLEGKVATLNLTLFGIALLIHILVFPEGVVDHDRATSLELLVNRVVEITCIVLSFPVGWLFHSFTGTTSGNEAILTVIYVPLNAYFWGMSFKWFLVFLGKHKRRGGFCNSR